MTPLETLHRYCCIDSCVTLEISNKCDKFLQPKSREHYQFNMVLQNALMYMELRGIKYDKKKAKERLKEVNLQIYERQHDLDLMSGRGISNPDKTALRQMVRDTMCYKRDSSQVKADYSDGAYDWAMGVLGTDQALSKAELGRLGIELGLSLNLRSRKDFATYLYKELGLPEQRHPKTKQLCTDYERLLNLKKKTKHPIIDAVLPLSELVTRASQLEMRVDPDGRVRSSYNGVGSETGRVTCKKSPTGTGRNMQATADENTLKDEEDPLREGLRDLMLADDDCYMAKCDLKGADGWTVGANMAALGEESMLKDLLAGVKPAQVLALALTYLLKGDYAMARNVVVEKNLEKLKEMCSVIKKDDWLYFACKQCIWGFCYLMGSQKAASHVFKVSEGQVDLSTSQMDGLKQLLFLRYRVKVWWDATQNKLSRQPYPPRFTSPSGHTRMFFGRRQEVLGEALAHEPQSITTYATNKAVYNCWTDKENRIVLPLPQRVQPNPRYNPSSSLLAMRVEPLHQVHDEFLTQFKITDTDWAISKLKSWFNNEINIAGIKIVIPFEGVICRDWAANKESFVRSI